jgi:hypothetical protein
MIGPGQEEGVSAFSGDGDAPATVPAGAARRDSRE